LAQFDKKGVYLLQYNEWSFTSHFQCSSFILCVLVFVLRLILLCISLVVVVILVYTDKIVDQLVSEPGFKITASQPQNSKEAIQQFFFFSHR
jgi:hypothetical protein